MEAQPAETYWTLTQGRDAHPGDGHSPGGDFHPERDTRQEGILTRRGHLPGGDTHQRGTLTHGRGHSPGGDTHQWGTLARGGHSPGWGHSPGGHTRQRGTLTQVGTLTGGTLASGGHSPGWGHSPGGDTRQRGTLTRVGTLTREGHSPTGGDTHQEGTFARGGHPPRWGHLPGRDTHPWGGTLTQEDTAGHARDALDLGDVVVEKVLVTGSAVRGAVAEDAPERGGH